MASLKSTLVSLLIADSAVNAIADDRVFIQDVPQNEERPYVVIATAASEGHPDLLGDTDSLRADTVALGIWSRSSMTTESLARAVNDFIKDYSGPVLSQVVKEDEQDEVFQPKANEEYSVYGVILTYRMFWYP